MAGYRRFVAYVYEYQKEKKGSNCGFVKVEVRGDICRIDLHLQCPGLISGSECRVYGFVRNRGLLDGILLGSCMTEAESAECVLETSAEHMGDSERTLDEMGGMIFTADQGGFFGTEWDDQVIRPGNFRIVEEKKMPEKEQAKTVEPEDQRLEDQRPEDQRTEDQRPKDQEAGEQRLEEQKAEEATPEIPDTESAENDQEAQELHSQSVQEAEVSNLPPRPLPGTPCDAFLDGELSDCRKISPQDLCRLGRRTCMLRNNRFVQYGSYNFGHLLLCRNNCGQLILGVPGGYDQQERFMANMFGFPYFKESRHIQIPGGRGGYWYRLIDSTDANHRDGRS